MFVKIAAERVGVPISDMCMIGDRLYTDIALGSTAGIMTVLVFSGETRHEDLAGSPHRPSCTFEHLGAVADAITHSRNET